MDGWRVLDHVWPGLLEHQWMDGCVLESVGLCVAWVA